MGVGFSRPGDAARDAVGRACAPRPVSVAIALSFLGVVVRCYRMAITDVGVVPACIARWCSCLAGLALANPGTRCRARGSSEVCDRHENHARVARLLLSLKKGGTFSAEELRSRPYCSLSSVGYMKESVISPVFILVWLNPPRRSVVFCPLQPSSPSSSLKSCMYLQRAYGKMSCKIEWSDHTRLVHGEAYRNSCWKQMFELVAESLTAAAADGARTSVGCTLLLSFLIISCATGYPEGWLTVFGC